MESKRGGGGMERGRVQSDRGGGSGGEQGGRER